MLFAVACSKEEVPSSILGDWSLVDYTCVGVITGEASSSTDVQTWTFDDKGYLSVNKVDYYPYTIRANRLIITYNKNKVTYELEELSDKELKVYWFTPQSMYQQGYESWYTFVRR